MHRENTKQNEHAGSAAASLLLHSPCGPPWAAHGSTPAGLFASCQPLAGSAAWLLASHVVACLRLALAAPTWLLAAPLKKKTWLPAAGWRVGRSLLPLGLYEKIVAC